MNFRANSLQPVAGATGVISRVQLPAAGRIAIQVAAGASRALPPGNPAGAGANRHHDQARQQARHRAQCRANCMSKANF